MSTQFATRFLPALVLGAIALATPAGAQDRYDREYEHYRRDRHEAQHHRWDDRWNSHRSGDYYRNDDYYRHDDYRSRDGRDGWR